jgi:predicted PurR-regulated permease PerM
LTATTLTLGRGLVLVFVTFVIAFFLAVEPGTGGRMINRLAPAPWRPHLALVAGAAQQKIGAWARGQVLVALIFGTLMGAGLMILGVPFAVSLGTIAAVLEVVPYVGGGITVVLASLMALTVGVPQLIGVVVLYIVLVNLESHVLAPLLFGRAVGMPPLIILLALFAGVELLGIVGALLAVPVSVIVWAVVDELRSPKLAATGPGTFDRSGWA